MISERDKVDVTFHVELDGIRIAFQKYLDERHKDVSGLLTKYFQRLKEGELARMLEEAVAQKVREVVKQEIDRAAMTIADQRARAAVEKLLAKLYE